MEIPGYGAVAAAPAGFPDRMPFKRGRIPGLRPVLVSVAACMTVLAVLVFMTSEVNEGQRQDELLGAIMQDLSLIPFHKVQPHVDGRCLSL